MVFINKKLKKYLLKATFFVVFFTVICIFFLVFFQQPIARIALHSNKKALINKAVNNSRICSGKGLSFSCTNLFQDNSKTKEDVINKAQYLYVKLNPYLIGIKTIEFEYVPIDVKKTYKLSKLEIEAIPNKVITVSSVINKEDGAIIPISNTIKHTGYLIFSYSFQNFDNPPRYLRLWGLINGTLTVNYLNNKQEKVAINEIQTHSNKESVINVHDTTFRKNMGYGKILSSTFSNFPWTVNVLRVNLNGATIDKNDSRIEAKELTTDGITFNSFGEWIIELEVHSGSFNNFLLKTQGIFNLAAVASTVPIEKLSQAFQIKETIKTSNSGELRLSLETDYFLMKSLFSKGIVFNSSLNEFLFKTWKYMNNNLGIDKLVNVSYDFNTLNGLTEDVFSIPYSSLDLNLTESWTKPKGILKMLNQSITSLKLNGIVVDTNEILNFPNLKILKLVNARITNTVFLKRTTALTKLEILDLSENDLGGDAALFKNISNFPLINLKLSGANLIGNSIISYVASSSIKPIDRSLQTLDLSNNNYDTIPNLNNKFKSLISLSFKNNKIKSVVFLEQMTTPLKILNLNGNRINLNRLFLLSNVLKASLVNLDVGNNPELKTVFHTGDAAFPNLETLNIEATNFSAEVINSLEHLDTPKLKSINLGSNSLFENVLYKITLFLQKYSLSELKLYNNNLSNIQLAILLDKTIVPKLKMLDVSHNKRLTKLPNMDTIGYNNLKNLNISDTNISNLTQMNLSILNAMNVHNFSLSSIKNLSSSTKVNFMNSTIMINSLDKIKNNRQINIVGATIFFPNNNVYELMALKITSVNDMVKSLQKKILDDANKHRETLELDALEKLPKDPLIEPKSLLEPISYQNLLISMKISNKIDKEKDLVNNLTKETDFLLKNNRYEYKKMKTIVKTFKISFDNYGTFWSKSYLAAIVLAPLMIIIFSLTNWLFSYHYYKIKKMKKSRGIYENRLNQKKEKV